MSAQDPRATDKNIWMPSLPSQVRDRGGDHFGCSTSPQKSGPQGPPRGLSTPPQHAAHVSEEGKGPTTKIFDGDEWIRSLTEAQEITADVPEECIMYDQEGEDPNKFVPCRWEFLRTYVSRRLLALSEGEIGQAEIGALTTGMRQLDVGSQGGAEAHAIFHQLTFDERTSGTLVAPLAKIKVDEN